MDGLHLHATHEWKWNCMKSWQAAYRRAWPKQPTLLAAPAMVHACMHDLLQHGRGSGPTALPLPQHSCACALVGVQPALCMPSLRCMLRDSTCSGMGRRSSTTGCHAAARRVHRSSPRCVTRLQGRCHAGRTRADCLWPRLHCSLHVAHEWASGEVIGRGTGSPPSQPLTTAPTRTHTRLQPNGDEAWVLLLEKAVAKFKARPKGVGERCTHFVNIGCECDV